ncbi:purine-nucleoside phosphorylase [Staphylococcus agnetis]|uniref:Purine nucleoside phosphorylase DeoD-type n=1 Tax=Staphylococcus agnetis TaxID=985762 RepID=A0ABD7TWW7_9STAP|nr:purine-nucleoside phosphorylase [Staphylococcus agnetis]MBY7664713.1 purine-nucleoside phosphorylase [Staphylococcus agnetis]MCO4325565.1 purine-nucleoside phosphorylase [Staphylococcus agnetis]MCO4337480.1 purine-nucleoside phosphorylase [Staphylococcus agnetis]MCO4339951.1 purine-nucleoside phosphorylase [Staphylococcus agnetis]MCO4342283.1 purine-nucleoside phosphorylase [Staphylococcus agnetis]
MKSTPHIKPLNGVDIAETVLLPGDPLRAKFIAETYLEDVQQFNTVRNMFGYTGTYKGKKVSVMGSGMGIPSIGIYSYELIHTFGCKKLIRVGSCGAMQEHINLYDVIIAQGASTDSNYVNQYQLPGHFSPIASYHLLEKAVNKARENGTTYHVGNILSSDIFYNADETASKRWMRMGILGVEMESAALYMNATYAGVEALGIFTVSDHLIREEFTTPEERERAFTDMIEIALSLA